MAAANGLIGIVAGILTGLKKPIPLYVQISRNNIRIQRADDVERKVFEDQGTFSTEQNLAGDKEQLETLLRDRILQISGGRIERHKWQVIFHPTEQMPGGLPEMLNQNLQELARSVFGVSPVIWEGRHLSPKEALDLLANPPKSWSASSKSGTRFSLRKHDKTMP